MYIITLQVDAPPGNAIGIKEIAAMAFEGCGDTKVVDIKEIAPEQLQIGGR